MTAFVLLALETKKEKKKRRRDGKKSKAKQSAIDLGRRGILKRDT